MLNVLSKGNQDRKKDKDHHKGKITPINEY
jgi:hypothetical protein